MKSSSPTFFIQKLQDLTKDMLDTREKFMEKMRMRTDIGFTIIIFTRYIRKKQDQKMGRILDNQPGKLQKL